MIRKFLYDILTDPHTGDKLSYTADGKQLTSDSGNIYNIENDIPLLLPSKISKDTKAADLHSEYSTGFEYIEHYTNDAETFDYFAGHTSAVTQNEILRLEEYIANEVPSSATLILDVGCGNGWVAKHFSRARKVISMDIARRNVEKVQAESNNENHNGLIADVYHLPLLPGSIDCIIAAEIIEHVPDPATFIELLLKAIKPGGSLIISTPYKEKIEYYLCVHCNKPTPKNAHLHSFDEFKMAGYVPKGYNYAIKVFSNKWMLKFRTYLLTRPLSVKVWTAVDKIANSLFNSPTRLLVTIKKPV